MLAEHYIDAESYEKGAEYSRFAGRKSEKSASLNDAIGYTKKRIACYEKLPVTNDVKKMIIDARVRLGIYYLQYANFLEARNAVETIVEQVVERDDKRRMAQVNTILGCFNHSIEGDLALGFRQLEEASRIAEEVKDVISLANANYFLGAFCSQSCKFNKALSHFERGLEVNVAANSLWGISVVKSNIGKYVYDYQGKVALGYQTTNEALSMAEESGDTYSIAMAYMCHGYSCFFKGFLIEAEKYSLRSVDICERIHFIGVLNAALEHLCEIYFELGEYQKSEHYHEKLIKLQEQGIHSPLKSNPFKISWAKSRLMNDKKDFNLENLYDYVVNNELLRYKIYEGSMRKDIAWILMNMDDHDMNEAEDWIREAIEADDRNGMMWHLGRDYALYAELFKRKGDQSQAKENLNKAIEILKECGADGWVKKYEEELAQLF